MVRNLNFLRWWPGFDPWSRSQDPTNYTVWPEKKKYTVKSSQVNVYLPSLLISIWRSHFEEMILYFRFII